MTRGEDDTHSTRAQPASTTTDCRLDFFSPSFDAHLALRTASLQPPRPRVRALERLTQCAVLLPPEVEGVDDEYGHTWTQQEHPGPRTQQRAEEQQATRERAKQRGERAHRRANAAAEAVEVSFARAHREASTGPLRILTSALDEKRRVRVYTRHRCGLRGSMVGRLILFDRHCNMVLRDVDEEYTVRLRQGRLVASKSDTEGSTARTTPTYRPKTERRSRHMQQVLIRGEFVVMVALLIDDAIR